MGSGYLVSKLGTNKTAKALPGYLCLTTPDIGRCSAHIFDKPFFSHLVDTVNAKSYICFTICIEMAREYLGEFEELVLTMTGILQDEAYGNAIVKEIEDRLDRRVNLSAVHVTLYRLEDKGYLRSRMGGATQTRGGRRKRIFSVTNAGLSVLRTMKEARIDLWKLIPRLH